MHENNFNIGIVGTGPVGLITAIALQHSTEFNIKLFGPKPTPTMIENDTRTTAFMAPTLKLLERCKIWEKCNHNASPLKNLRMIDDCGTLIRAPECYFSSEELNMPAFAQNIPNADLNKALIQMIEEKPNIEWVETDKVTHIENNLDEVTLTTSENENFTLDFCIGADGRNSICRSATSIKTTKWQYDQTAISCSFTHSTPHKATSIEIHRRTGPMTLIPLEEYRSSIVWSLKPEEAQAIETLSDEAFSALLYENSHAILGEITSIEPRKAFPISGLKCDKYAENRIALVGEAAHVIPPIGAQGMNLGLRDAAHLIDILIKHPDLSKSSNQITLHYNQSRKSDILSRTYVVDFLNKSLLLNNISLKSIRSAGLSIMRKFKSMRQFIMQQGLGDEHSLPSLMKTKP